MNKISESAACKSVTSLIKDSVVRKRFLISDFNISTHFFCDLVNLSCFQTYEGLFFTFCRSNSTKNWAHIYCSVMKNLLKIIDEQSSTSQDFDIDFERLNVFNTKLKIWNFTNRSFGDYQNLSFDDHSFFACSCCFLATVFLSSTFIVS